MQIIIGNMWESNTSTVFEKNRFWSIANRANNYDNFYHMGRKQNKIPLCFEDILLVLPLIWDFRKDLALVSMDDGAVASALGSHKLLKLQRGKSGRWEDVNRKWSQQCVLQQNVGLLHFTCVSFAGGIGCLGYDRGQTRKCLDAVEIYNPDGDFWRDGPPMPSPLLSLRTNSTSAGCVEGKLYLCGGFHGAGTKMSPTSSV